MAAPWLRNLVQSTGFATAIGNFGSQMLAAPDFGQGLAGLGQMPGQLQALKAEEELRQAQERRMKAEERLRVLQIAQGERADRMGGLEEAALPGKIADEATMRGLNLTGMQEKQNRERQSYEAAANYQAPPGVPPELAELVKTDPRLATQLGMSQLPPTPFEQQKYEDAQTRATQQMEAEAAYRTELLNRQKAEVEERAKKAEQEAALRLAEIDREGFALQAKMLTTRKEAWLEQHPLVGQEKWTQEVKDQWEEFRTKEAELMNQHERSMNKTRLLLGGESDAGPEKPVDPRLVTAEVAEKVFGGDGQRAAQLLTKIEAAGLWPELQQLLRSGRPVETAIEEVKQKLGAQRAPRWDQLLRQIPNSGAPGENEGW